MSRLLSTVFACLLSLSSGGLASAASLNDYWQHPEFYQANPEQLLWLDQLSAAVRANPVPIEYEQSRPIRIGLVYPSHQSSSYWTNNEKAFRKRLQQLGMRYELRARYTTPSTELGEQVAQIHELLQWQPDYLVYTLDSVRQKMIIERMMLNQNTKLILQNITTPLKAWGDQQPFFYSGFDHVEGARRLAEYLSQRFPEQARYAVLFRGKGMISQMRGTGFIQSVSDRHELVASYYTDSSRDSGKNVAQRLLSEHPELDYIYACSTDVALGALDALEQEGQLGEIVLNGWGGGAEELEQLRQHKLQVVLMRMNDDSAIAMAEAIKRDQAGQPVPLVYSGNFVVLDEETGEHNIQRYERLARRASQEAGD